MLVSERELREALGDWASNDRPVYLALAERLAELAAQGRVPVGARLPAERRLALALNVSRGTVVAAYERLREQGIVRTRHGSGTVVDDGSVHLSGPRDAHLSATLARNTIFAGFLSDTGTIVDLRGAYWIGTEELPREAFTHPPAELDLLLEDHGYQPAGLTALREAIAARLSATGLPTTAEQVLVTTGAQQAIMLIAELVLSPGDRALVEEFTFAGALDAFVSAEARVRTTPLGPKGVDPAALRDRIARIQPRLVYLCPVHNPTGQVLPSLARRRVAEALAGWEGVLLEDLTLAETQVRGTMPPPIASFMDDDPRTTVLTVGSLSKVMWGGLRVGWIRGPEPVIHRLARIKALVDLGTPLLDQAVAARLLADADEIRMRRVAGIQERCAVLADGLRRELPSWEFTEPEAGLCLWVRLPGGASAVEFAAVAMRHGVAVVPGGVSAPEGGGSDRLRIAFGQRPDLVEEGVRRLASAWREWSGLSAPRAELSVLV